MNKITEFRSEINNWFQAQELQYSKQQTIISSVAIRIIKLLEFLGFLLLDTTLPLSPSPLDILNNRAPLIDYLKNYIDLDEHGYPLGDENLSFNCSLLKTRLAETPADKALLKDLFFLVAAGGDAGYAHDMRALLSGQGIVSDQVTKGDNSMPLNSIAFSLPYMPHSCVNRPDFLANRAPTYIYPDHYIDEWGNAIHLGHKKALQNKAPLLDLAQKMHYEVSIQRIEQLHRNGLLLARIGTDSEIKNHADHKPAPDKNELLSHTLLPEKNSVLRVRLYMPGSGLLSDPLRVAQEDFGLAFHKMPFTAWTNFDKVHNGKFRVQGAKNLLTQRDFQQSLDTVVRAGGEIDRVEEKLINSDMWEFNYRPPEKGEKQNFGINRLNINETVIFSPKGGDVMIGLMYYDTFFDRTSRSHKLKKLFEAQAYIRLTTGRYLPIYEYNKPTNELFALHPSDVNIPLKNIEDLSTLGISEQTVVDVYLPSFSEKNKDEGVLQFLIRQQLALFNLVRSENSSYSIDTLSLQIKTQNNRRPFFPTFSFFSQDYVYGDFKLKKLLQKELQTEETLRKTFLALLQDNIKSVLGLTLISNEQSVTATVDFDKFLTPEYAAKIECQKTLSKAMQSALEFNIFEEKTKETISQIVAAIRIRYPNFGYKNRQSRNKIDMILGSLQMQDILNNANVAVNYFTNQLEFPDSLQSLKIRSKL